jgi:M6 family metalloprotease-like protein
VRRNGLVILANFSDTTGTTGTRAKFDAMFNQLSYTAGRTRGSVRDYYREVSYGQLELTNHVTDWVKLPKTSDYYSSSDGGRAREMARAAGAFQAH